MAKSSSKNNPTPKLPKGMTTNRPSYAPVAEFPKTDAERMAIIADDLSRMVRPYSFNDVLTGDVNIYALRVDMDYQRDSGPTLSKIHQHWDKNQVGPIILSYRDGELFIVDGKHRRDEAMARGIIFLPAIVHLNWTKEMEAEHFAAQTKAITTIKAADTFKVNLLLGESIDTAIKTACDNYGLKVTTNRWTKDTKILTALTTARYVVHTAGAECLEWIFNLMDNAKWFTERGAATDKHLRAFCNIYVEGRQYDKLDEYAERLLDAIKNIPPSTIDSFADTRYVYKEIRSAVASLIIDIARGVITRADIVKDDDANTP